MAQNLGLAQFVYKYPDDASTTDGFGPGIDICQLLGGLELVSVGIQAPYGTKFYINGKKGFIPPTGSFEVDNIMPVTSLIIEDIDAVYLSKVIVDVIYRKGV